MNGPLNKTYLDMLFRDFDTTCQMSYLYALGTLVCQSPPEVHSAIGFIHISQLPESEDCASFAYTLNALSTLNATFGYFLTFTDHTPTLYIGLKSTPYLKETLAAIYSGLTHTFPTITATLLTPEESLNLMKKIFHPNIYAIGAISTIPSSPSTPILNHFNHLMGTTKDFTLLLLATPCPPHIVATKLTALRTLSSELSSFSTESHSFSTVFSENNSATHSNSATLTKGRSHTNIDLQGSAVNYAEYTNFTPSTALPLGDTNKLSLGLTANKGRGHNHNTSTTCTCGDSDSDTQTHGANKQCGKSQTEKDNLSYTSHNKNVDDMMGTIDNLITHYANLTYPNTLTFSAYVLSPSLSTTTLASHLYLGCTHSQPAFMPTAVNVFTQESEAFTDVLKSLEGFNHPLFTLRKNPLAVSSAHIISTSELLPTLYFN